MRRTGPTCELCGELAAVIIEGRSLCGGHGLLVELWGINEVSLYE